MALLAGACLVVVMAGCSAGGAGGSLPAAAGVAPGQVAAAMFVQEWGQILFGLVANQTGSGSPVFGTPVANPDGSVSQSFTGADGTGAVLTIYPDGSARLDVTYPSGTTQVTQQAIPTFDGVSKTTTDWTITSSDGLAVTYRSVVDDHGIWWDASQDTTTLNGTATLPKGVSQTFSSLTDSGKTTLTSTQSDGSTFTWQVPLQLPDYILPDFSQATTGTYRGPAANVQFTLASSTAVPTRWAGMSSNFGSGLTGQFALDPGFAGNGSLVQAGATSAFVSWTRAGDIHVRLVAGDSTAASPAGAALDYLLHRWQTLAALFAPAPGASASAASRAILLRLRPPHRSSRQ
jgi:hypothetical protein